ncbi:MAG: Transcriptional regulatory protein ZraR [Chromatiales bacterium USCg_Taylor]|nr:MAG: Transcriptional regulatory protein ZraR [Chromatiales bacterium USCg_Taylor]
MVWLSSESQREACHVGIIGRSQAMRQVQERVERLARSDVTTLVCGETGTGKEIIAQALHRLSARSSGPCVRVNCAGIPDGLVESELFGHVKGAFTGAIQDRLGRFESAHRGTLFLDEIGDVSPAVQVCLLRAVETKCIERVGNHRTRELDVRIIAATNKSLEEEVRAGRFRLDLYYRLHIASIELPPLRRRLEDIPLLVQHFIEQGNRRLPYPIEGIKADAMERLMRHPWPGNVRELRNAIECAFVNAQDEHIRLSDLPPHLHASPSAAMLGSSGPAKCPPPFAFDAPSLRGVLTDNRWHIGHAAACLGVHRTTLWRHMQRLHVTSPRSER